ncbi:hypothetical protein [Flavobacterium sp. GNP001]
MKKFILYTLLTFSTSFYSQDFDRGFLEENNRIKLLEELSQLSGIKIDKMNVVVVNFYTMPKTEPNGSCIDYYTNNYGYLKFIKKNKNIVQFFITERSYVYSRKNVLEDKNDEIKKMLFEKAKSCGNYIVIKPTGEFTRKFGEYRQDEIPKLIKQ